MPQLVVGIKRGVDRATLEPWWRDLEPRSAASFFLSWSWIGTWLDLAPIKPDAVVVRAEERIVALGLLVAGSARRHGWLTARSLHLNATGDDSWDVIAIEGNGLLVDRAIERPATRAALAHLLADGGDWDELHCPGVPPDFAEGVAGAEPLIRSDAGSGVVDLAAVRASGRPYLDGLSANARQQLRRAMRGYEARGPLRLALAQTPAAAVAAFERLGELHQAYWTGRGQAGAFAYPFFTRFHKALIERHHAADLVELVRVSAGETEIGYLYNFLWHGRVLSYQSGFAYEADPKLKPGMVSHALCIERHLAAGASAYDFLAGDARYKTSLGRPGPRSAYLILQRPRLKFAVERGLTRAKRLLRG